MSRLSLNHRWKQTPPEHGEPSHGWGHGLGHSQRITADELLKQLGAYLDETAVASIRAACRFAAAAHAGQTRESGEAYIHHPLAVARILGQMRADGGTIVAAILHDVVEDTEITLAQLAARFGDEVAMLVDGVSKVSQLEQAPKERAEAASFKKMLEAAHLDSRVIVIKLCDRLHNMRTLGALKEEKMRRVANQTMEIYAPFANRLGMRDLAQELADLSLLNLYPKRYNAIAKRLNAKKRRRQSELGDLCDDIKKALVKIGIKARVYGREKEISSAYRKMQQKKLRLKNIQDINAIRVVTETRPQCYQALGVVHQIHKPRPAKFKDYIAVPKANGYQSLHTVVVDSLGQPVEVQIRSEMMDRVAKNGVAAHWRYKIATTGEHAPERLMKKWLADFLEASQKSHDSEYLEHLKAELYPDAAYLFTPKGDIMRLPLNATVLDFAYAVHTDIGNRCCGARINQKMAAPNQTLNNGDHIEIITSRRASPKPKWLDYTVTPKARSSIRHFLKQQKDKESFALGRKLLKQALHEQGYRRMRIPSGHKVALLKHLGVNDWNQLVRDIGFGRRLPALVAKQLIAESIGAAEAPCEPSGAMIIEGTERLVVTFAQCCHPIPGDDISGAMVSGRGLIVHRAGCQEITRHLDNYHRLAWAERVTGKFQAMLKIEVSNKPGVLALVSNIIAQHHSNIDNIQISSSHHNTSSMSLAIEVTERDHLAIIMRQLLDEEAVINLSRA